jgi:GTP-binding protein
MTKLATPKLTRLLLDATLKQQPPRHGGFRPRCATPTRAG